MEGAPEETEWPAGGKQQPGEVLALSLYPSSGGMRNRPRGADPGCQDFKEGNGHLDGGEQSWVGGPPALPPYQMLEVHQ